MSVDRECAIHSSVHAMTPGVSVFCLSFLSFFFLIKEGSHTLDCQPLTFGIRHLYVLKSPFTLTLLIVIFSQHISNVSFIYLFSFSFRGLWFLAFLIVRIEHHCRLKQKVKGHLGY